MFSNRQRFVSSVLSERYLSEPRVPNYSRRRIRKSTKGYARYKFTRDRRCHFNIIVRLQTYTTIAFPKPSMIVYITLPPSDRVIRVNDPSVFVDGTRSHFTGQLKIRATSVFFCSSVQIVVFYSYAAVTRKRRNFVSVVARVFPTLFQST